MIIELTNYTVTAKDEITWGDAEKIQSALQSGAKIQGNATEQSTRYEFDTSAILEAKYVTFERTISKITDKSNENVIPFTREWIDNLPISDGNKLYEAVNSLTKKD